ncbi:hypothetical protein [Paenibacillus sp. FSL R10-2771]|uniref:hypothetical protein n=1 Tax=Paenibacillus sp. FSL R10-2771 TaxID=2954693 RepID=UPI0030FB4068
MISKCFVFDAGAYGFSFNDYHTTCLVENNYVLQPTLGGYFVGNRDNISLSKGMTYSTFASNACDGGAIAYTFAGCRALAVNGCGCEVVSNRAIYVSGTESSVSIDGFLGDRVGGNGIYIEGNRAKVTIDGYVDSNPINIGIPLIAGGGTDAKVIIANITNKRTYLYDSAATLDVSSLNNKKHKVVNFYVKNKAVATFKHPSGYSINYGGLISIRCFHGGSSAPNGSINTATYYLLLNKGTGGSNIATVSFAGLKGDETALQSWPSFDFTFSGDS